MFNFMVPVPARFGNYMLKDLNEIIFPQNIAFTPQTLGAWILLGLLIICVLLVTWWLIRRWRMNAYRREAAMILSGGPIAESVALVPSNLRRVAEKAYPNLPVGALTGSDWFHFLNVSAKTALFPTKIQIQLQKVSFQSPSTWKDEEELNSLVVGAALQWIEKHDPKKAIKL